MKGIYLIIIVCLMTSCIFSKSNRNESKQNLDLSVETISTNKLAKNMAETKSSSEILELPVIGRFELNKMKLDSLNKYGGGDCFGTMRRYSLPNVGLAIDSMNCDEWGYTYTYYLLSENDIIQVVFTKKSESISSNPDNSSYFFVQQEQVIDFNSDPATTMKRIDTVYNYNLRHNQIDKKFVTDTLKDMQTTYEHLKIDYNRKWKMKLNN